MEDKELDDRTFFICERLGVEKGEQFKIKGDSGIYYIDEEGYMREKGGTGSIAFYKYVFDVINNPEMVIHGPFFTKEEANVCKALGADFVTRDKYNPSYSVKLWKREPSIRQDVYCAGGNDAILLGEIYGDSGLFDLSVNLGDCVRVREKS